MSNLNPSQKKKVSLFSALLLLVLWILLIKNVDFSQIIRAISSVSLWLLLPLLGLQLLTQCLLAVQWQFISRLFTNNITFSQIFYILSTGSVIEALTPGAKVGGEVTRLYYLKKECNLTTEEATHVILIQKSISMSVLFTICLGSFFLLTRQIRSLLSFVQSGLLIFLCLLSLAFFCGLLFLPARIARFLERKKGVFPQKIGGLFRGYHDSVSQLSAKQWGLQFLLSSTVWLLFPLKMVLLVQGLGFSMEPLFLFATTMTSYMVGLLPLTPGGLGTFEGTVVAFFTLVDMTIEDSVAIAVTFRFVTFWFVMLISTLWVVLYRKKASCGKTI